MATQDNQQEQQVEQETSLRDDLSAAFDRAQENAQEQPPEKPAEAKKPEEGQEQSPEKLEQSAAEKARDEKGRFAPKESTNQSQAKENTQQTSKESQPAPKPLEPPLAWKGPDKEKFKTLPPDIQKIIVDREAEAHRKITSQDDERAFAKQMRDMLHPYRPMLASRGMNEVQATQQLMNLWYTLQTAAPAQKAELLYNIGMQTGADFVGLATAQAQGRPAVDPNVSQLQTQIQQMQAQLAQQAQAAQQSQVTGFQKQIDAFRADPAHPHFDQVQDEMTKLIQAGVASDLQKAYDMAIWGHPDLRSTLIEAQSKASQEAKEQELREKANKKLHASGSLKGAPTGAPPAGKAQNRSLRDDLSAAFDAAVSNR